MTDTEGRPGVRGAAWAALPLLAALLGAAAVAAIAIGSTGIAWGTVVRVLASRALPAGWIDLGGISEAEQVIVWIIRTPRVAVAALVGGALAVAGTQMQGLFRNPLAEPSVIGISQGAALGAVVTFVSGLAAAAVFWLPLFAFAGALAALAAVHAVATRAGRTPVATLLLAGIALGSLSTAVATLLISLSVVNWQVANEVVFWLMGGSTTARGPMCGCACRRWRWARWRRAGTRAISTCCCSARRRRRASASTSSGCAARCSRRRPC